MSKLLIATLALVVAARGEPCSDGSDTCQASDDEVTLAQLRATKLHSHTSRVACNYGGACNGDQCCPGAEQTCGQTYKCPNAGASFQGCEYNDAVPKPGCDHGGGGGSGNSCCCWWWPAGDAKTCGNCGNCQKGTPQEYCHGGQSGSLWCPNGGGNENLLQKSSTAAISLARDALGSSRSNLVGDQAFISVTAKCPVSTYAEFDHLYSKETAGNTWARIEQIDSWVRGALPAVGAPLSVRKLHDCYKSTLSTVQQKDFTDNVVAPMFSKGISPTTVEDGEECNVLWRTVCKSGSTCYVAQPMPGASGVCVQDGSNCKANDHVPCPVSGNMCSGNQCCPGVDASGGKTFPCPSASDTVNCQTSVAITTCVG